MKADSNILRMRPEREDATRSARKRRESSDRRALRRITRQNEARAVARALDGWVDFYTQEAR